MNKTEVLLCIYISFSNAVLSHLSPLLWTTFSTQVRSRTELIRNEGCDRLRACEAALGDKAHRKRLREPAGVMKIARSRDVIRTEQK